MNCTILTHANNRIQENWSCDGRATCCKDILQHLNPNAVKSYKISQKLSPKHAARGVAQSPYPIYRHGKACLSKQPPWRAAGDPRLARGRSRVWAPGLTGALRALFFSTLPFFLLREIVFSHLPHCKSVRVNRKKSLRQHRMQALAAMSNIFS